MRLIGILSLVLLPACATSNMTGSTLSTTTVVGAGGERSSLAMIAHSEPITRDMPALPAAVWAQLPAVYAELGIPLSVLVQKDMLLGNQGFNIRKAIGGVAMRNYLQCGDASGTPNADIYQISMNIATQVQRQPDSTSRVATVLDATASPMSVGTETVQCATTGQLEERINEMLARRLHF